MARLTGRTGAGVDSEGGGADAYLECGVHLVTAGFVRMFRYGEPRAHPGVEYRFMSDDGRVVKGSWYLKENDWNLDKYTSFLVACGLTQDQIDAFDTEIEEHHLAADGKRLWVAVARSRDKRQASGYSKFAEVVAWGKAEDDLHPSRWQSSSTMDEVASPAHVARGGTPGEGAVPDDGLPF